MDVNRNMWPFTSLSSEARKIYACCPFSTLHHSIPNTMDIHGSGSGSLSARGGRRGGGRSCLEGHSGPVSQYVLHHPYGHIYPPPIPEESNPTPPHPAARLWLPSAPVLRKAIFIGVCYVKSLGI